MTNFTMNLVTDNPEIFAFGENQRFQFSQFRGNGSRPFIARNMGPLTTSAGLEKAKTGPSLFLYLRRIFDL